MDPAPFSLIPPFVFLICYILIVLLVYLTQSKIKSKEKPKVEEFSDNPLAKPSGTMSILQWEFDYIKTTASEAMRDRHTMTNYYLIVVGIVSSGVISLLKKDSGFPTTAATVLLWFLCTIGMFYFLKIIRLRQAWHDSALAMNRIKKVFVLNSGSKELLENAFLWSVDTLPTANRKWNVFHYSAMFIAFINSVAFLAGSVLINLRINSVTNLPEVTSGFCYWTCLILFGLVLFIFHDFMYNKFLE